MTFDQLRRQVQARRRPGAAPRSTRGSRRRSRPRSRRRARRASGWPRSSSIHHSRAATHRRRRRRRRRCVRPIPSAAQASSERRRVGEWMAPGPDRRGEVRVEVEEDRAGQVPPRICRAAGAGVRQVPAHVGDAHGRVVREGGELGDGDQAHGPSIASAEAGAAIRGPRGGRNAGASALGAVGRSNDERRPASCSAAVGRARAILPRGPAARGRPRPSPRRSPRSGVAQW